MRTGDIASFFGNQTMASFIPLTDIKTQGDAEHYFTKGYLGVCTFGNFQKAFPDVDATKIYFCCGGVSAYYFDKENLILFPVWVAGTEFVGPPDKTLKEMIDNGIAFFEESNAEGNYSDGMFALDNRIRMEYLNLLLDSGKTVGMYQSFLDYYSSSDFGCDAISPENMEKLLSLKSEKEVKATQNALKEFPEVVTIYRGEGDKSTPYSKAWSWSADVNVASFFAARFNSEKARIITATVSKNDIMEYIEGNESEILVNPHRVTVISAVELFGSDFLEAIPKTVLNLYKEYRDILLQMDFPNHSGHDRLHTARVLLLALILGDLLNISKVEMHTLATAALFHDIGRICDGVDESHGMRSSEIYKDMCQTEIFEGYNPVTDFLIETHCLPDEVGYSRGFIEHRYGQLPPETEILFNIFKDADALDRVRFGIRSLDIKQLRLDISKKLLSIANLCVDGVKL